MAEAYLYRREDVTDQNGNVIDTALVRLPNPRAGAGAMGGGAVAGGRGAVGVVGGRGALDWSSAEYRGVSRGGRVRQYIRSAAGRGAARNPAMRNNRYGI
jgi:hypothetical protein